MAFKENPDGSTMKLLILPCIRFYKANGANCDMVAKANNNVAVVRNDLDLDGIFRFVGDNSKSSFVQKNLSVNHIYYSYKLRD